MCLVPRVSRTRMDSEACCRGPSMLVGVPEAIFYGGWRQSKDHHPLALRVARAREPREISRLTVGASLQIRRPV